MKWLCMILILKIAPLFINGGIETGIQIEKSLQKKVINLTKQLLHCRDLIHVRKNRCRVTGDILVKEIHLVIRRLVPNSDSTLKKVSAIRSLYTDCNYVLQTGRYVSEVYPIWLKVGYRFIHIYCDMESGSHITNKTGWKTFQQRKNGKINFNRGWDDYVNGFGNPNEDYWAGLENTYLLTRQNEIGFSYGYRTTRPNLRIDLEGWDGFHAYVEYKPFSINPEENYSISGLGVRFGTAFHPDYRGSILPNDFSTFDHTSETSFFISNCPGPHNSGWWFFGCGYSNLNGIYQRPTDKMSKSDGIYWRHWTLINPNNTALKLASMKIQYYR
uniref:Self-incompatibility-linked fibrinogen-like protein-B n=1 Tax=Ciona intestinalis TaxID=7719 RepID=A0A143RFU4_CIOIN|nr:self-incompatibility-linked fibrinogen-like protein-B [Ciona intestinalis]